MKSGNSEDILASPVDAPPSFPALYQISGRLQYTFANTPKGEDEMTWGEHCREIQMRKSRFQINHKSYLTWRVSSVEGHGPKRLTVRWRVRDVGYGGTRYGGYGGTVRWVRWYGTVGTVQWVQACAPTVPYPPYSPKNPKHRFQMTWPWSKWQCE